MADLSALHSIAELLPAERRERFFEIANKFATAREDDDHLQMLEAVGFMLVVMKEIPAELAQILQAAQPGIGGAEPERLRTELASVLTESLDTPSYKDLRDTVSAMRDHETRFRNKIDEMHRCLTDSERRFKAAARIAPALVSGILGGLVASIVVGFALFWIGQRSSISFQGIGNLPDKLAPYVELHRRGELDYLEAEIPDFGGKVGIFLLQGDVVTAFRDGDRGIVVHNPRHLKD